MVTISFYLEILYCLRTLDIFVYHLMKTVEIFRLDMFGLDAYLVQPEENKKSPELLRQLNIGLCALYMLNVHDIDG